MGKVFLLNFVVDVVTVLWLVHFFSDKERGFHVICLNLLSLCSFKDSKLRHMFVIPSATTVYVSELIEWMVFAAWKLH